MTFDRIAISALCVMLLQSPAAVATARDGGTALHDDYPAGSIASVAQAEDVLRRAPQAYADLGRQLQHEKAACYERFLVSSCLADVQQRQRDARTTIRRVEVEARALLRKERAAERDRALAERERRATAEGGRAIPLSGAAREGPEPDAPKVGKE
ncbi:MAG: hypothetical protein NBV65_08450 [Burkholderiaceae bacterium]|nr:hypothetical protein [Burkholderiaceae bacterium]